MGVEVLGAICETGLAQELPVHRNASDADVAEIEQRMARAAEIPGVSVDVTGAIDESVKTPARRRVKTWLPRPRLNSGDPVGPAVPYTEPSQN